jgi:hypothetical protein
MERLRLDRHLLGGAHLVRTDLVGSHLVGQRLDGADLERRLLVLQSLELTHCGGYASRHPPYRTTGGARTTTPGAA